MKKHVQLFAVSFFVPQERLSTVLEVITKEVTGLKVEATDNGPINTMKMPRSKRKQGASPVTDCGRAFIKSLSAGAEFRTADMREALKKGGFKESNYGPVLATLANENLFTSPKKGLYIKRGGK